MRFCYMNNLMLKEKSQIFKNIKPGTNVLLENKNFGKIMEKYVGWYPDHLFLITTLKAIPGIRNVLDNLSSSVTIRFLLDGKIYTGKTSIFYYTFRPTGLLFLKEPTNLEKIVVRKTERIKCSFPGGVAHEKNDKFFPGLIVDLSEGGAGFVFKDPWHMEQFKVGEKVKLKITFILQEKEFIIPSYIKRFFHKRENIGIGLAFSSEAKEEIEFVKEFVKKILNVKVFLNS